jgi:hypothetical protein
MAKGKKTGGRDFKPGQVTNPKGGPGLPRDLKEARKLNQLELERVMNRFFFSPRYVLKQVMDDPEAPMIELIGASIIHESFAKACHYRLEFLLNRLIGKVQDRIEVKTPEPYIIRKTDGGEIELGAKPKEDEDES